jgi:hypothetical protein
MKLEKRRAVWLASGLVGAIVLSAMTAQAGDVTVNVSATVTSSITETEGQPMAFGTIDLVPGGDTITIDASDAATPEGVAGTISSANGSGTDVAAAEATIEVTSAIGTDFNIDVVYPADGAASVTDGTTVVPINSVQALSGNGLGGTISHTGAGAGSPTVIHVGGELVFPAGATTGAYTGTMTVTLNYS